MLHHAMLAIENSNTGEWLAIPVIDFPVIPVGAEISIWLNDDRCFDFGKILRYSTGNKYGVQVDIELLAACKEPPSDEQKDAAWTKIMDLCVTDRHLFDYVYPKTLDYGCKYILPNLR